MKAYLDNNNYIMIRFTHKGIKHKISLKKKLAPQYWDRLLGKVMTNYKNHEEVNDLIESCIEAIDDLKRGWFNGIPKDELHRRIGDILTFKTLSGNFWTYSLEVKEIWKTTKSESYLENYDYATKGFMEQSGLFLLIKEIKPITLTKWVEHLQKTLAPATVELRLKVVKQILRRAGMEGIQTDPLCQEVRVKVPKKVKFHLTDHEIDTILSYETSKSRYLALKMLMLTGVRVSDLHQQEP